MAILRVAATAVVACFALSSCGSSGDDGTDSEKSKTRLEKAYSTCGEPEDEPATIEGRELGDALEIADAGETLIIQTDGESDTTGYLDYVCVMTSLGTSERVQSSIGHTTSMMGRQSTEDDGLIYEYTYHPDNGLYVLIAETE
ncbi:hypothetical protein [Nocardioides hwasunensis]|uniref:Uncharacterized protein n=1 Tax=Nocardioides hwasunensis TaxID=397258 RepID=A0ABR8MGH7_9ACTN|nr:hypothetical protein [Nocardioides hwasunensis]MBD3913589.1 hypothetical protein [Nocardioides hwasunensis]